MRFSRFRKVMFVILPSAFVWPARAGDLVFEQTYVDVNYGGNSKPGWVRAGDVDNDCDLDLVAGGGNALFVYENDGTGQWPRYGSLDATGQMGCNGAVLHDVDKDGDLDVVAAQYNFDLGWWKNPGGSPAETTWAFHVFASDFQDWYLHDLIRADLDLDDRAEEFIAVLTYGYWNAPFHLYWFRPQNDPLAPWERHTITENQAGPNNNHAGVDTADLDGDGDIDVSFSNGWFESPGDPGGDWIWHEVTNVYGVSNSLMRDIDGDGDLDLVMSAGHHGQGVYWFENTGKPAEGPWTHNNISKVVGDITQRHQYAADTTEHLHHPEGLEVYDIDGDGDLDVVVCELFFGEDPGEPAWSDQVHNVYLFENLGGEPLTWRKHNIAPDSYPSHLLSLIDIDADRRLDVISQGAGMSVVSLYENRIPPRPLYRVAGDFDCDGTIDLDDYRVFSNCMAGPDQAPEPAPPVAPEACLDAFDFDGDDDVDLVDAMVLGADLTGE